MSYFPGLSMITKRGFAFFIFCCLSLCAFAQKDYAFLLHKRYEQRCRLIDSLFYPITKHYDTVALANELQQVSLFATQEKDEELYLEIEYQKLRSTTGKVPDNRVEKRLQNLIQQARRKNYPQLEIQAIYQLAFYYYVICNNVGASVEQYLNAYYLMKQMPVARFPDKRDYVYNDLASIYYGLEDYDNAKAILLEADKLPFYPVPYAIKLRGLINVDNTLGLIYRITARYDSAVFYFKKAHAIALQGKDSVWVGIAGGNIGITYFLQKRYAEALPLLENDVRLSTLYKEYGNAANSLLKLAEINLIQHNKVTAYQQMVQVRELTTPASTDFYPHLNSYYLLMARLYSADGNTGMAYRYADSALMLRDTLFQLKSAVGLAKARQKTDIEHHRLEVATLEQEQKIQTLVRNGLLSMLVLLIIITLLLVSRQRLLKKQKQFAETRRQQAQQSLDEARKQLQNFTASIREKNELLERLTAEMDNLQTNLNKEAIDYRQNTLSQLRQHTILTEEEWESFKTSFEKVYPAWFEAIKKKLPGLSAADLRFMALSKLKFTPREMASVLGISPASIRVSRHRIRKKYNLTEEESLELLAEEV